MQSVLGFALIRDDPAPGANDHRVMRDLEQLPQHFTFVSGKKWTLRGMQGEYGVAGARTSRRGFLQFVKRPGDCNTCAGGLRRRRSFPGLKERMPDSSPDG